MRPIVNECKVVFIFMIIFTSEFSSLYCNVVQCCFLLDGRPGGPGGAAHNPVSRLRKLPGESGRGFSLRINSAVKALLNPAEELQYPVCSLCLYFLFITNTDLYLWYIYLMYKLVFIYIFHNT